MRDSLEVIPKESGLPQQRSASVFPGEDLPFSKYFANFVWFHSDLELSSLRPHHNSSPGAYQQLSQLEEGPSSYPPQHFGGFGKLNSVTVPEVMLI
jgi:hypothetical protein